MEELFRDRIHEALEVEPTPAHLRARVMASLPAATRRSSRPALQLGGQWAAGLVAAFLALAIIAGLVYVRSHSLAVPVRPPVIPPVGLISPEGVAVAPDGTVYVSDFLGDRVFKLRPDGHVSLYAGGGSGGDGLALKASLNHPAGLAMDRSGNLYIADASGSAIRRIDTRGNISTVDVFSETGRVYVQVPMGVAIDSSGALWISEFYGDLRQIFINDGGRSNRLDFSSVPPPNVVPGYLAFDKSGDLYVSDRSPGASDNPIYASPIGGGCRIIRLTPDRMLSIIAGTGKCGFSGDGGPATSAQIDDPNGIAFDAAGNLYFSDANNHRIRRIDKNGIITTVAGTGVQGYVDGPRTQAQLAFPFGLGASQSGLLYFSDATCSCWNPSTPGRVRVLDLASGLITTVMDGQTPIAE